MVQGKRRYQKIQSVRCVPPPVFWYASTCFSALAILPFFTLLTVIFGVRVTVLCIMSPHRPNVPHLLDMSPSFMFPDVVIQVLAKDEHACTSFMFPVFYQFYSNAIFSASSFPGVSKFSLAWNAFFLPQLFLLFLLFYFSRQIEKIGIVFSYFLNRPTVEKASSWMYLLCKDLSQRFSTFYTFSHFNLS